MSGKINFHALLILLEASSKSDVKEILKLSLSYPTDDEQFRTASESFVMEKVNCDSRKAQNLLQNVYLLSKKLNTEGMTHDSMVSLFPEYFHEKLRNLLIKLLVVTSTSVTEKEEQRTQPEPEEHPVEQKSTASISMRHEHNIRQEKVEKVQQEGKIPDMIISPSPILHDFKCEILIRRSGGGSSSSDSKGGTGSSSSDFGSVPEVLLELDLLRVNQGLESGSGRSGSTQNYDDGDDNPDIIRRDTQMIKERLVLTPSVLNQTIKDLTKLRDQLFSNLNQASES